MGTTDLILLSCKLASLLEINRISSHVKLLRQLGPIQSRTLNTAGPQSLSQFLLLPVQPLSSSGRHQMTDFLP